MQHLEFGHSEFIARADRTLWHKKSDTLFLSDLHLGKGAHFRQAGIPIPEASELSDLNRLIQAIKNTQAKTVWVLGDLFHQPQSISSAQMDRWQHVLDPLQVELNVILGNHDRQAESFACALGFLIYPEPTLWRGIELAHHPNDESAYRIAGHIHPQLNSKRHLIALVIHASRSNIDGFYFRHSLRFPVALAFSLKMRTVLQSSTTMYCLQ